MTTPSAVSPRRVKRHPEDIGWPTTGRDCQHCAGTGKEPDHRQLGEDLRRFREWHEATLTNVAAEMGLSKSYVCDLELGRRPWRQELILNYRLAVVHVGDA